jgi:acetoin utilization protein AcuB
MASKKSAPAAKKTTATKAPAKAVAAKPAPKTSKAPPAPVKGKTAAPGPLTVASYMTKSPHTIGIDQSLERAHELMNKHRIRHLPVLDNGELVGVVSQRDLYFIETLDSAARANITVEEAMTADVFQTRADATLESVTSAMVKKKLGCAVITDGNKVTGIYSTIDAMRALLDALKS